MKNEKLKIFFILLVFLILIVSLVSCKNKDKKILNTIDDLDNESICIKIGNSAEPIIRAKYPNLTLQFVDDNSTGLMQVYSGKASAVLFDEPEAKLLVSKNNRIKILEGRITEEEYAFALNKEETELTNKINGAISYLKSQGVIEDLYEKWITNADENVKVEYDNNADTSNGVLRVAVEPTLNGLLFVKGNEYAGFEYELIVKICEYLGMKLEITVNKFASLFNDIESKKVDMIASCITITDERKERVLFTDVVYTGGSVFIVENDNVEVDNNNLWKRIKNTIFTENRYILIFKGIGITSSLTLISGILGTVTAYGFAFFLIIKNKFATRFYSIVSTVLSRLPIVLILMILYYIVFGTTKISAYLIALIGFTFCFSNTVVGIINTGSIAVSSGQIEAAEALGYKQNKIYRKIIFPQVAIQMIDTYRIAFVKLLKDTAIVGFITIQDITRISDIIRGRTYDALAPLIISSFVYLILSGLLIIGINRLFKLFNPFERKLRLKGVKKYDHN